MGHNIYEIGGQST